MRTPPPSRRIADALRERIAAGEFGPGDQLPSERELVAAHQVARNTARAALLILGAEGLVVARHGRGVFVRRHPAPPVARSWDERREVVAAMMRQVAAWGNTHVTREAADEVEFGRVAGWLVCPLCQSTPCDDDCVLAPVRASLPAVPPTIRPKGTP